MHSKSSERKPAFQAGSHDAQNNRRKMEGDKILFIRGEA
ncbi:hypothetical protein CHCC14820_3062 [Bacillus paralicheniformis]|uniref:Uncharacterized protein n=1 Tax=Bacillus paralicheniformis TaxID=1648923 RepID=A0A7Z0WZ65_9BACI|nr:hypothetical protein B4121_1344 [Bacillus paralicheniformis]TWK26373.1 hypothetical protein CHCC20372_1417 [Bacillus paralicheniformis]TWK38667.1 hypothetical protein CHCC20347_3926 [Bacillus paralicheniformis]TWM35407.1 hypothetical protein CHCC14820_3062 [Bacillus paralicheniformis]